jgi:transposase
MTKDVRLAALRIESAIQEYKEKTPKKEIDYKTYEEQFKARLKKCFCELVPLVEEAVSTIKIIEVEKRGAERKLTLKQEVMLLLLQKLFQKSNRSMSLMLVVFVWLNDIDISYKTIERKYSDSLVRIAIYNLHTLLLKKRGIQNVELCGDGTGYSVHISEHYATISQKRKEKAKENKGSQKFVYSFVIMDLKTRLYVAYGFSLKSEKEAFMEAINLLKSLDIKVISLRLDKYFSCAVYAQFIQNKFGKVTLYLIPKTNIAHVGLGIWKDNVKRFVDNVFEFLKEYFKRNQSESGFSEDKKRTGWKISQKIPVRIDTALQLNNLWHNLYWVGAEV